MARPEKRRNSLIWRRFPRRIEKRSAPSVAGAAPWSLAPATWPSTLVLRLALQVPLQPPRLPRVSDFPGPSPGEEGRSSVRPFGPRLFGLGILGSPARAETLGASEKGGRQPSGRRRLLRRPREGWGPNPVLARARGAPQAPLLLGCVSRHPGVGLRETRGGFCHPLPETRPPSPPRRSLQDLRELFAGFQLRDSARIRLGSLKRCPAAPSALAL